MEGRGALMPLTPLQERVLALLAEGRSPESHLAGAAGIHLSPESPRRSHDLDLFHDSEKAVADAFEGDRRALEEAGLDVGVQLSQPGFIRAVVTDAKESILVDWAHDSHWRFMPPVRFEGVGWVLHPVDLAVNKVLALAGRDEPRDYVDVLYLDEKVLPLGALIWAAVGKDPGLNPQMLVDLSRRKGRYHSEDFARLDLARSFDPVAAKRQYIEALNSAESWVRERPADEAGCLYVDTTTGRFFAPSAGEEAAVHRGGPGGVFPQVRGLTTESFIQSPLLRSELEAFFARKLR